MITLGIHGNFFSKQWVNEASASLCIDGVLKACVAEERLSRVKMDGSFPVNAIKDVLKIAKITIDQVDYIAATSLHPSDTNKKYLQSVLSTFADTGHLLSSKLRSFGESYIYHLIKTSRHIEVDVLGRKMPLNFFDHHMCHAAGAYYCSPFENALVITLDGGGDGLDGGAYIASGTQILRFMEIPHFQSPGTMYSAVTNDLGFKRHRHEGKITGLAAFGNPDPGRLGLENLLKYNKSKGRFISKKVARHHKNLLAKSDYFYPLMPKFTKEDLAAATQQIFETEVLAFVVDAHERALRAGNKLEYICLAGGCFANVKLNQRIFETGRFKDIFIFPAMGDDGLSAGAALLQHYKVKQGLTKENSVLKNVYLGNEYDSKTVETALENSILKYEKRENIEQHIAMLLTEGKVVARFNGRMEYGPRSLGNRSVIAAANDKNINDWLNKKFRRTEFMPFAPSIIEEHASEYLKNYNGEAAADFMTITYDIIEGMEKMIPAVVHVDQTARPQVVKKSANPSYHAIISEYYKLTGVPIVLNTSFNMHEEPIVYTPEDAIRGFIDAELDILAIGDFLAYLP